MADDSLATLVHVEIEMAMKTTRIRPSHRCHFRSDQDDGH
jgi:hypothetical protein